MHATESTTIETWFYIAGFPLATPSNVNESENQDNDNFNTPFVCKSKDN